MDQHSKVTCVTTTNEIHRCQNRKNTDANKKVPIPSCCSNFLSISFSATTKIFSAGDPPPD